MGVRIVLSAAVGLGLVVPALAGPCTQRLADLEKRVTAKQEGGGPALANPAPSGSGSDAAHQAPAPVPAQSLGDNDAMALIRQAKDLDRQGKEAECMQVADKIGAAAPPAR